jgi:F-type H+-transporting ATPase subunit b
MEAFLEEPKTWVAVAFVIFVAFAVWKGWKPLMAMLDGRGERIRAELDEAQKLREDAQHLLAEYQRKQRDAVHEAEGMLKAAEEEAARIAEKAAVDLKASLARREQQALDRIAQAEAQAQREVRNLAADLAIAATRKLLVENLDNKTAEKLIDESIKNLPGKLH